MVSLVGFPPAQLFHIVQNNHIQHTYLVLWFKSLDMPRRLIKAFFRFRLVHSLLPHHSFHLLLNSSPLCPLHKREAIYATPFIYNFSLSLLLPNRLLLFSPLFSVGYPHLATNFLLNSRSPVVIGTLHNQFYSKSWL